MNQLDDSNDSNKTLHETVVLRDQGFDHESAHFVDSFECNSFSLDFNHESKTIWYA